MDPARCLLWQVIMPTAVLFRPPYCPNTACDFHLDSRGWRYKRAGYYARSIRPFRIQRYRCFTCRRSFSAQTFSISYRLRRPDLLDDVFHGEVSCSGHRQLARRHGVSHTTIQRLVARIGRHCLLIHESLRARARERLASEPVLMDGMGAFARGQYWPIEITGLIGCRSYYSHDFVVTPQRRSGSMTDEQKVRRAGYETRLGRPDPEALRKDVSELLRACLPRTEPVELRTDEKTEYVTALSGLARPGIEHVTTHSKRPRTPRNPLFAVNAHHMFLRHSGSNHKRETVAFSKCFKAVVWRHAIFQVWKNLVKGASERDPSQTPAQRLGVTSRKWTIPELLAIERAPTRTAMRQRVRRSYIGIEPRPFSNMVGRGTV